ncbi:MAG: zinc ribbon domain-containing protein [Chloracidobacterium sp.]|nr:zinc ribbon domain-containing protein [Chloracidobacterium sp.]
MGLQQCDKCGEMVDEAKAFCPGCGNAFVEEEKRQEASKFEKLESTVQYGQTMYNQMLEDMGLNIVGAPSSVEKRVEVVVPVKTEIVLPVKTAKTVTVKPAVTEQDTIAEKHKPVSYTKWYILLGVAAVFLLPLALASTIFVIFEIWSRFK